MDLPIIVISDPTHIRLEVGPSLRDDGWAFIAGRFQTLLNAETTRKVAVDFSRTKWADPLPLLALTCLIARAKGQRPHLNVNVRFGRINQSEGDRFLLFASTHGFIRCLSAFCTTTSFQGKSFSSDTIGVLETLVQQSNVVPAYANAECIRAHILPLSNKTKLEISETIGQLLAEAIVRINRWLPNSSRQRSSIIHKFRQLLGEALDNIIEHAYDKGDPHGFGAVFARIRTGTPEDRQDFLTWNGARIAERDHCPALNRSNAARQPGWLEIFVCDVGCGLTIGLSDDKKAPLLELGSKLFNEALSKERDRAAAGKTELTGLQHIGLLLQNRSSEERGDFVRIYSSGEWLGEHLPWPRVGLAAGYRNYRGEVSECLSGTSLHFALEPSPAGREEQLLEYPTFFHCPTASELGLIRNGLEDTTEGIFAPPFSLLDLRSTTASPIDRGKRFAAVASKIHGKVAIIRPSRSVRKADIFDQILSVRSSAPQVRMIIFADLSGLLAIDIALILQHQRLPPARDLSILCVTQDWICAAFDLERTIGSLIPNKDLARDFIIAETAEMSAPLLAKILRDEDTTRFWAELGDAYLNEPIVWSSSTGETMDLVGYVDIPIAMSRPVAFDSARRAVRRAIAAFGTSYVLTSDSVTSSYIGDEFEVFDGTKSLSGRDIGRPTVGVGSILVSGSTSQRISRRTDIALVGWVHLMRHPTATARITSIQALIWKPPKIAPRIPSQIFERISGSAFLIRGGESAIPVPRFDSPANGKLGKSLYGASPNEMYDYWQRLQILRMGHWTYSRHHDLLTIDLAQALDFETGAHGRIVPWVTKILASWKREFHRRASLVVYPRNRVTDKLARLISEQARDAVPTLFPLQAVHSSSVSPLMISPIERERLGQLLRSDFQNGGLVVQLDDGELTGRTMEQLTQVIQGLWEALKEVELIPKRASLEIRSLALVDRRGTPNQRRLVKQKSKSHQRLWRWDVPTLGYDGRCPLCSTLDRCRDFVARVPEGLLHARLHHWIDFWSPRPVDQMSMDRGLTPKAVPADDWTKFGIEKLPDGTVLEHKVRHSYSTSRAAIAMEICRSTTRKDYPFQKARSGLFKNGAPMDLQTRIEILVAQIFLFWDELSFMDRVERLSLAVNLLWESTDATNATALAAISLQIDSSNASTIWPHLAKKVEELGFPNDDALLAALMIDGSQTLVQVEQQTHKSWSLFQVLKRSSPQLQESLSRIFHVLGWSELSIHGGVLLDLLKASPLTEKELNRTVLLLKALASAFKTLTPEMVGMTDIDPARDAAQLLTFVERLEGIGRTLVESGELAPDTSPSLAAVAYLTRDDSENEVRRLLAEVHEFLFVGRPSLQMSYNSSLTVEISSKVRPGSLLEQAHVELKKKWHAHVNSKQPHAKAWLDRSPEIVHLPEQGPDKPLYVYCDAVVVQAITELLSNVVHSSRPIECPWKGQIIGLADMWTRVTIVDDGAAVRIDLANSKGDATTSSGPRETVSSIHVRNIGGEIDFDFEPTSGVFSTILKLPTIAGLAWQGG